MASEKPFQPLGTQPVSAGFVRLAELFRARWAPWFGLAALIAAGCGGGEVDLHCQAEESHAGQATYYGATGAGACSFSASPGDLMVGAMNVVDYAGSGACGACVHLKGPHAEIDIRIVDLCPECPQGNVDLSEEAFGRIAELSAGRVAISWQYVPCEVDGPILYHFKEGSNPWWTGVQIRNGRNRVAKLEYLANGAYREIDRTEYNYFVEASGMGVGPFSFRTTDIYGHTLEDSGVPLSDDGTASGASQFPTCSAP